MGGNTYDHVFACDLPIFLSEKSTWEILRKIPSGILSLVICDTETVCFFNSALIFLASITFPGLLANLGCRQQADCPIFLDYAHCLLKTACNSQNMLTVCFFLNTFPVLLGLCKKVFGLLHSTDNGFINCHGRKMVTTFQPSMLFYSLSFT